MRLLVFLCVLFCGPLAAQASVAVSGSATQTTDRMVLLDVDFGATAQSVQIELEFAANSGTAGIRFSLLDLDRRAADTSSTAHASGFAFDTNTATATLTTASYSGIRQFLLQVNPFQDGNMQFTGTVSSTALPVGAITIAEQNSFSTSNFEPAQVVFGRQIRYGVATGTTGHITRDFDVLFGSTPEAITFAVEASSLGDGTIRILDVTTGADELDAKTLPGLGIIRFNVTTGQHSGTARLRVQLEPEGGAYGWTLTFPQEVTVLGNVTGTGGGSTGPTGGGGGGGGGGCQAGTTAGVWLLAALLGLGLLHRRRPRTA